MLPSAINRLTVLRSIWDVSWVARGLLYCVVWSNEISYLVVTTWGKWAAPDVQKMNDIGHLWFDCGWWCLSFFSRYHYRVSCVLPWHNVWRLCTRTVNFCWSHPQTILFYASWTLFSGNIGFSFTDSDKVSHSCVSELVISAIFQTNMFHKMQYFGGN